MRLLLFTYHSRKVFVSEVGDSTMKSKLGLELSLSVERSLEGE